MEIVFMVMGFCIASYSIVANDALQTLGTFLSANASRPWWQLWLYAASILVSVLVYGWMVNGGDVAYGRLDRIPLPDPVTWYYVIPPLVLLVLTRMGVPISTTFLILTIFSPKSLPDMLIKSGLGYVVAFSAAIGIYLAVSTVLEKRFLETANDEPRPYWMGLQWLSTGFLWSQWLIQDLANIFVYLPRDLPGSWLAGCLSVMLGMLAYTFYTAGGAIQQIVTSKTNTDDIRSATLINFLYGLVLMVFKEWSKIPMSTTWVFLGLLAGRELAMGWRLAVRPTSETLRIVGSDAAKAFAGLAVSVIIAVGLPIVAGIEYEDEPAAVTAPVEAPTP